MESCAESNVRDDQNGTHAQTGNNNVNKESGSLQQQQQHAFHPQQLLQLPQYRSESNLSESNISDTVSESSDNATLLSLSKDDLLAMGVGSIREDVRVNRKRMETLILRERENDGEKGYMETLMERTNTYIQWPSKMKIGAKTKKDLYVRIYGHDVDDVNEAKAHVLADFGPNRDLRITLKMEISYTDHSHLIGCRGATIRRVMEDTGCHIHFPDSNRMSKEHKSNQVTIAGSSVRTVEQARFRVRELSPLIFQFNLPMMQPPYDMIMNPDAHHVFVENIQSTYNVQVTIHPPNKLQQTTVSVKGCEMDAFRVKEAVMKIIGYFASGAPVSSVTVESIMEISPMQHSFVRAVNDSNVHAIMMNTGAKVIFPDLSDCNIQHIKRSRVYISGELNCVYHARQQLIGSLPLRMIFDLADEFQLDWEGVRRVGSELNVNIKLINRNRVSDRSISGGNASLPPPVPGRSRTIQLVAAERNTGNIYEARRRILGPSEPSHIANIPPAYALRVVPGNPNQYNNGNVNSTGRPGGLTPMLMPMSPNLPSPVLSPSFWPPTPFSSPFCSPTMANCGGIGAHLGDSLGPPMHPMSSPNNGVQQPRYNKNYNNGNNNNNNMISNNGFSSSPGGNPSPKMTYLKSQMTLPLTDTLNHQQQQQQPQMNSLSSCTSSLSMYSAGEESPLPLSVPTPNSGSTPYKERNFINSMRKAPGWERSNTYPNLLANSSSNNTNGGSANKAASLTSTGGTPSDSNDGGTSGSSSSNISPTPGSHPPPGFSSFEKSENGSGGNLGITDAETNAEGNRISMTEKKYMAVQAMYYSKVGPSPRKPTGEWAGCGFSKTHLSLFPVTQTEKDREGMNEATDVEGHISKDQDDKVKSINNNSLGPDEGKEGYLATTPVNSSKMTNNNGKRLLTPQQSNLLEFASPRTKEMERDSAQPTDLASLFIAQGLEKYIDTFVSEEIDLDVFATLTEEDLRSLGVSSFPARKRMLLLIAQFSNESRFGSLALS